MPRIPKRLLALSGLVAGAGAAAAALRRRRADRPTTPAPSADAPAQDTPPPPPGSHVPADDATYTEAPPVETPGPSVTPPRDPSSTTEREERAEALAPDPQLLTDRAGGPVDELVERETAAAAAEAAEIGGPQPGDAVTDDPAMGPVYEAGGGEAEGFEQAEADLIENASHGGGAANPVRDAFTPEIESDESTTVDAEPDEEKVSEVVKDVPEAGTTDAAEAERIDDPGAGPGRTHEV